MVRATGGSAVPARRERGQGLVEFALVLTPMMLILLGIIQFGFIFNAYVTLTNASREAAREGSIYVYDLTLTKAQNDTARNNRIKSSLTASMNLLTKTAPNFTTGTTWSQSGQTFSNGDLTVAYVIPTGVTDSEPRTGQQVTVSAVYHQDLLIPLISALLPKDGGGRLALTGQVTMVIN
ncbi:MAG: TadE/TadG family type IV pilus assembly protein [Chloroflexota bacterium]